MSYPGKRSVTVAKLRDEAMAAAAMLREIGSYALCDARQPYSTAQIVGRAMSLKQAALAMPRPHDRHEPDEGG